MSESDDISDVWDKLLEDGEISKKTDTQMGLPALSKMQKVMEESGEYMAVKSQDLYEGFGGRESTDRYHRPFSEADIIPEDVEEFFDELLDEMLETTKAQPATDQGVEVEEQLERKNIRRQLLLWFLAIEQLEGAHLIRLPVGEGKSPMELLVIDGNISLALRVTGKPFLDTQLKKEQPALCDRIRHELTQHTHDGLANELKYNILISANFELDDQERRALMERMLRLFSTAARVNLSRVLPLEEVSCTTPSVQPITFNLLDLFVFQDSNEQVHDTLSSQAFTRLAKKFKAESWLLHHIEPLHPFDALIDHTKETDHSLSSATQNTLLGNASRQLMRSCGFTSGGLMFAALSQQHFTMLFQDKDFINTQRYPQSHMPRIIGQALSLTQQYKDNTTPQAFQAPVEDTLSSDMQSFVEPSDRIKALAKDVPGCNMVMLYNIPEASQHNQDFWEGYVPDITNSEMQHFAHHKSNIRAMRSAMDQMYLTLAQQDRYEEFYIFDSQTMCFILPLGGELRKIAVWYCDFSNNFGMIRAQASMNAMNLLAQA